MTTATAPIEATAGDGLSICVALDDDLDTVNAIIRSAVASWPLPERLRRLATPVMQFSRAELEEHHTLIAFENGRPNAIAAWRRTPAPAGGGSRDAQLYALYVAADTQRAGIGSALEAAVARAALRDGARRLWLRAERVASGFFTRRGYAPLPDAGYPHTLARTLRGAGRR